jgi:hypothetical protein
LPHVILGGEGANLAALRQDAETQATFLSQRGDALVATAVPCRVCWQDEKDVTIAGDVFITSCQVLFVASNNNNDNDAEQHDFAIGATCITLHAMTEEPELALYLQLSMGSGGGGGGDDDDETSEVTITPLDPESSQVLFDGLCQLVSLHPLEVDDEDEIGGGGNPFGGGDELIWAEQPTSSSSGGGGGAAFDEEGGASEAERATMLDRLDNLLIVGPDLEVLEGQFEDADEEAGKDLQRFEDADEQ